MFTRKKYLTVLAVAVLVLVTIGLTFTFLFNAQLPAQALIAKPPVYGYIEDSKIYLLSANSSYGDYKGSQCFIITVTVRNDYTPQNPPDNSSHANTGSAFFILSAKAYDKNNAEIETQRYIPPHGIPSNNQQGLGSGETLTYNIYLTVTQQKNDIDHYDLEFTYLGSYWAP